MVKCRAPIRHNNSRLRLIRETDIENVRTSAKKLETAGMRARVFKRAINDRVQNNSGQGKKSDGEIISAQL